MQSLQLGKATGISTNVPAMTMSVGVVEDDASGEPGAPSLFADICATRSFIWSRLSAPVSLHSSLAWMSADTAARCPWSRSMNGMLNGGVVPGGPSCAFFSRDSAKSSGLTSDVGRKTVARVPGRLGNKPAISVYRVAWGTKASGQQGCIQGKNRTPKAAYDNAKEKDGPLSPPVLVVVAALFGV